MHIVFAYAMVLKLCCFRVFFMCYMLDFRVSARGDYTVQKPLWDPVVRVIALS